MPLLSWSECIQFPASHQLHTEGLKRSNTLCCLKACVCKPVAQSVMVRMHTLPSLISTAHTLPSFTSTALKRSSTMCCCRQEAERLPFVGDLEPILALQQGTTWLQLHFAKLAHSQAVICQWPQVIVIHSGWCLIFPSSDLCCRVSIRQCRLCCQNKKAGDHVQVNKTSTRRWQLLLSQFHFCLHGEPGAHSRPY